MLLGKQLEFIVGLRGNKNVQFTVGSVQFLDVTGRSAYSITDKIGHWSIKIQLIMTNLRLLKNVRYFDNSIITWTALESNICTIVEC
jgi:hypothetical protein